MDDSLMTIEDLARMLGVTRWTISAWIRLKKLPVLRISRRLVRFRREDIEKWLESKKEDIPASTKKPKNKIDRGIQYRNKESDLDRLYVSDIVARAKKETLDA